MIMQSGEVYACGNPLCAVKVLILRPPDSGPPEASQWRCMCGGIFALESTAESTVQESAPVHVLLPHSTGPGEDPE